MRFSFSTSHQFAAMSPYVDTLIVWSHTGFPYDVAVPHAASEWISRELAERLHELYPGRTSVRDGGTSAGWLGPDTALALFEGLPGHPIRAGLWLVERRLLPNQMEVATPNARWIVWDWWRWLERRVPPGRLADALFYLCAALPPYRNCAELRSLGIPEPTLVSAATEGERLWERLTDAAARALHQLWAKL
jgi:hypothetical protein